MSIRCIRRARAGVWKLLVALAFDTINEFVSFAHCHSTLLLLACWDNVRDGCLGPVMLRVLLCMQVLYSHSLMLNFSSSLSPSSDTMPKRRIQLGVHRSSMRPEGSDAPDHVMVSASKPDRPADLGPW